MQTNNAPINVAHEDFFTGEYCTTEQTLTATLDYGNDAIYTATVNRDNCEAIRNGKKG